MLALHQAASCVLPESAHGPRIGSLTPWLLPVELAATFAALSAETSVAVVSPSSHCVGSHENGFVEKFSHTL